MIQGWYATLRHPKMHPQTKFGIPTSNNMRYALEMIILKTRSEVKVTVTRQWYVTLPHPKMHPHTKFGIPTSKNIEGLHWTRSGAEGWTVLWGHKNKMHFVTANPSPLQVNKKIPHPLQFCLQSITVLFLH